LSDQPDPPNNPPGSPPSSNPASRMTTDEMVKAVAACDAMAWRIAQKFRFTNPRADLEELHAVAIAAFKMAALKFDTTIGRAKFSSYAYQAAWYELVLYCRNESANGMHVPSGDIYYAPRSPRSSKSVTTRRLTTAGADTPTGPMGRGSAARSSGSRSGARSRSGIGPSY
jgi:hypothetical protein